MMHWQYFIPFLTVSLLACEQPVQNQPAIARFAKYTISEPFQPNKYNNSVVLFNNYDQQIPFQHLLGHYFTIYHFGESYLTFESTFSKYANFVSNRKPKLHQLVKGTSNSISQDSTTIILIDQTTTNSAFFESFVWVINRLSEQEKIVIVNFGQPTKIGSFDPKIKILQVSDRSQYLESQAAQMLFGGSAIQATAAHYFSENILIQERPPIRLGYASPESVGVDSVKLASIDTIAQYGIDQQAYPGCQVLIAKSGKVIYNKTYGHHTYQKIRPVQTNDLYDLASVTKAAATTLAIMKLYEEGQLNLNAPIRQYVKGRSALYYIKIKDLLTHTSGLQPNIPIAKYIYHVKQNGAECDSLFCSYKTPPYTIKVAEDLYFNELELGKVWREVFQLRPRRRKRYRYSDVNFMILHKIIELQTQQSLDEYLTDHFYNPLGLRTAKYNPLATILPSNIIPTQLDTAWRKQLLQGNVHDEGAAFLGGVGGNAGLFSNAEDLAVIFQMLLNKGNYGGRDFLKPSTVQRFTAKQYGVHRGLGFDKPRDTKRYSPYASDASKQTFGHTGYTGTCVWADPEHELIFILLTNRIHPDRYNRQLNRLDIRSQMHQIVYDAMIVK